MTNSDAEDTNSPAGPGGTDNGTSTHQQPQDNGAAGASQQPLSDWARDHHLTSDTVEILKNNGCDTVLVVTSLTEPDVREMTLNIGQRRMLLRAIAISQDRATPSAGMGPLPGTSTAPASTATPRGPPVAGDAATQPTAPPGVSGETHTTTQPPVLPSGGDLLADLLGQGRQNGGAQAGSTTTTPAATDPEIYLHLAAQKGEVDYYDITDFVPGDFGGTAHAESVLGTSNDLEFVARPLGRKNKLQSVTPQQWAAANSAIMAKLIQDGLLGTAGISQYLNYTYKVGDLGQAYSWQSVLSYDRAYRKLQARLSFSWGTDISHLRATTLTPKHAVNVGVPGKAGQGRGVARQGGNRTTTGTFKDEGFNVRFNLCRDFNRGSCTREQCKFTHRCGVAGCFGQHPAVSHSEHVAAKK